jgi:hypothetical protein
LKNDVGNAQALSGSIAKLRQRNVQNESLYFCDVLTDEVRKTDNEAFMPCATKPIQRISSAFNPLKPKLV